ncbi:MAG TPA: hypothetical protein VN618_15520 [Solirubrobacteraceae bacterium]|nr:hypothetical protein [Solirubrobacteraceae bacterium]
MPSAPLIGLILYDGYLKAWRTPVVVYRATAKYSEARLRDRMASQDAATRLAVLVGAPSRETRVATALRRAQQLYAEVKPELRLGAVAIPERHARRGEEHLRLLAKQEAGCSYPITQVVGDPAESRSGRSRLRAPRAAGLQPARAASRLSRSALDRA